MTIILGMELSNVKDLDDDSFNNIYVGRSELNNLITEDPDVFELAMCEYLENEKNYDTNEAKVNTFYHDESFIIDNSIQLVTKEMWLHKRNKMKF